MFHIDVCLQVSWVKMEDLTILIHHTTMFTTDQRISVSMKWGWAGSTIRQWWGWAGSAIRQWWGWAGSTIRQWWGWAWSAIRQRWGWAGSTIRQWWGWAWLAIRQFLFYPLCTLIKHQCIAKDKAEWLEFLVWYHHGRLEYHLELMLYLGSWN